MRTGRISHPVNFNDQAAAALPGAALLQACGAYRRHTMDIAVLAITALFFALALAYVALCAKL